MPVSLYYIENHIPPHFRRSYFFSLTYICKSVKTKNKHIFYPFDFVHKFSFSFPLSPFGGGRIIDNLQIYNLQIENLQIDNIIEKDQFRWALYLIDADENDDAPPNLKDLLGGEPEGGGCTLLQQHTHRHFVIS